MSKTFKTRFGALCMALILALSLAVSASAAGSDFTIEDGVLTKYIGSGGDVTIPDGVTSIGDAAFVGCTDLTSVTIPDSVTSIGEFAFQNCWGLTGMTIPDGVTSIGYRAFSSCTGLTNVTIPDSVTSIGDEAFEGCTGLTSVTIPNSVTSMGSRVFMKTPWLDSLGPFAIVSGSLQAYQGEGGAVTIPDGVTSIGKYAFAHLMDLTSVTIPDSIARIEDNAFTGCLGLTNVTILGGVTSIGGSAFDFCMGLTSVTIPDSVTSIEGNAFGMCDALTDVYYTGNEEQWNAIEIKEANDSLTSATIHYNSTGPATPVQPQQPALPTVVQIPVTGTAAAKTQSVSVDGKPVEFQCYALREANGGVTNFVKLRDLAQILNGTAAQFAVGWDGTAQQVIIRSKESYAPNGSEGKTPFSGDRTYKADTTPVLFNGQNVPMTAFRLADDAGNGYTYYKLRDLGTLLNFHVDWSAERGVYIETDKPYQE